MDIQAIASSTQPIASKLPVKTAAATGKMSASDVQAMVAGIKQESSETVDQTKAEAAKGDVQALQKLAKINAQHAPSEVAPTATVAAGTTGTVINVKA